MYIFKKIKDLQDFLSRESGSLGFVPTMGALHQGHISLIARARKENVRVVCSIFINPTQFNDPVDFAKYPIRLASDIQQLSLAETDILFLPSIDEMYPEGLLSDSHFNIGYLDTVLEGAQRPGHFKGVCQIVDRLLFAVNPDKLYLGEKDYQQCLVIRKLLELSGRNTQLIICPTSRESNGLAMSSRNMRLSVSARDLAGLIFKCLQDINSNQNQVSFEELKEEKIKTLQANGFEIEYLLLANAETLQLLSEFTVSASMIVLIAVRKEGVRLIDNLRLKDAVYPS